MEKYREFFKVEIVDGDRKFFVLRPASINRPYDQSVMFIKEKMVEKWRVFCTVQDCLIYCQTAIQFLENSKNCTR